MFVTTYAGPATVLLEDGSQFSVNVTLHSSDFLGLERWWGAASGGGAAELRERVLTGTATLRLPDGHEGTVVSERTGALGGRVLQLTGTGPAPF
jgi:hypothetical protein